MSMASQFRIHDQEFVVTGGVFKTIRAMNEWDVDIDTPHIILKEIQNRNIRADLFTFGQRLPYTKHFLGFQVEMDNSAAIPITTYESWWKDVNRRVRLKVNKAERLGVLVRVSEFNDELVRQIKDIFDEFPLRQGVPFHHYQKPLSYIKERMGTYSERADFLCAYYQEEPIGILKLVYSGQSARMMTIVGKISHRDKAPVNAMLSKAVERCIQKGVSFLTYGKLYYGKKGLDSLAHFKIHNGFKKFDLPRYYAPLNGRGRLYLSLRLYRRPNEIIPESLARPMRDLRQRWYRARYKNTGAEES